MLCCSCVEDGTEQLRGGEDVPSSDGCHDLGATGSGCKRDAIAKGGGGEQLVKEAVVCVRCCCGLVQCPHVQLELVASKSRLLYYQNLSL